VTTKRKVFWGVFLPLTLLYAATRAPTVTGEDSGELVTAAWTLGVGHPPGYPLWILLTRLFMGILCPTLSPADGAALFSGITTALSLGVFATVSFRLTGAPLASWITALLLGLVPEIWNHATIAEVYPLNLLLVMWSLALLLDWQERPTRGGSSPLRWCVGSVFQTTRTSFYCCRFTRCRWSFLGESCSGTGGGLARGFLELSFRTWCTCRS